MINKFLYNILEALRRVPRSIGLPVLAVVAALLIWWLA